MKRSFSRAPLCLLVLAGSLIALTPTTGAQTCGGQWADGFGFATIASGPQAVAIFDSGTGPTLHVGAGPRVLRLDGNTWVQLGTNFLANLTGPTTGGGGDIRALTAFDDGSGMKLYAAGTFQRAPGGVVTRDIARWNNTTQTWEAFGPGSSTGSSPTRGIINAGLPTSPGVHFVLAMTVHDEDGPGPIAPALYATGRFSGAGLTQATGIVKWNGTAWQALTGSSGQGIDETGYALLSTDLDGDGPELPSLILGGNFNGVGGTPGTRYVAKWNSGNWSSLGSAPAFQLRSLAAFDPDGAGPLPRKLIAGLQSGDGVVELDTTTNAWTAFNGGVAGTPLSMLTIPSDSGDTLIVGGSFVTANGGTVPARSVAKWSTAGGWSQVGNELYTLCSAIGTGQTSSAAPTAMILHDTDGAGPTPQRLFAVGTWQTNGALVGMQNAAVLNASANAWSPVATSGGGSSSFAGFTIFDEDGDGPLPPAAYASAFGILGESQGADAARWNPTTRTWNRVGQCAAEILPGELTSATDGTASRLFIGGNAASAQTLKVFRNGAWEVFTGPGSSSVQVNAIAGIDLDGAGPGDTQLFAVRQSGGVTEILRWDGAAWTVSTAVDALPDLTVVDTGAGPMLYASGPFTNIGGNPTPGIAVFNPATGTWDALGSGITGVNFISRPAAATIAGSTALYIGGADAVTGNGVVFKWDGAAWTSVLASGRLNGRVQGVAGFNDGAGEALYLVGPFTSLDGMTIAPNILRWDGSAFAPVGAGLRTNGSFPLMTRFDDGTGEALWILNQASISPAASNMAVLRKVACACGPSDIAGPNQSIGPDGQLTADDIIVFLSWFFADDLRADVAGQNQSTTPDGSFTADDIIVFLGRYFAGC